MPRSVGRTFAVLSSRGSVNWLSGCSFIDAGRRITGDLSELTIQIECARNHARKICTDLGESFSNPSPEGGLS